MNNDVFLMNEGGEMTRMVRSKYESESILQELLERHPALIAAATGDQSLLLVRREAPIPDREGTAGRWSVDHLFVDVDATPILVEVKRSTDTRIRREMIGQMLDYAANAASFWTADSLASDFIATCDSDGRDPAYEVRAFAGSDPDGFWNRVAFNLGAGRMRLVFVADEVPFEVRRVVEFLNEQMTTLEVVAIEVRQYLGDREGVATIVPRLLGQTTRAEKSKQQGRGPAPRAWDEPSMLTAITEASGSAAADLARVILGWARDQDLSISFGFGAKYGAAYIGLDHRETRIRIGSFDSEGNYSLQLNALTDVAPFNDEGYLDQLIDRYEQVGAIKVPPSRRRKKPNFDIADVETDADRRAFFDALAFHVDSIRKAFAEG